MRTRGKKYVALKHKIFMIPPLSVRGSTKKRILDEAKIRDIKIGDRDKKADERVL